MYRWLAQAGTYCQLLMRVIATSARAAGSAQTAESVRAVQTAGSAREVQTAGSARVMQTAGSALEVLSQRGRHRWLGRCRFLG